MKGLNGIILVYNITSKITFDKINFWVEMMNENLDINTIPILLIGNKYDFVEYRVVVVTEKEGYNFVKGKKNMIFYECSAKTGENVEKAINELVENILKSNQPQKDTIKLTKEEKVGNKK